jgi:hypothetical protein
MENSKACKSWTVHTCDVKNMPLVVAFQNLPYFFIFFEIVKHSF